MFTMIILVYLLKFMCIPSFPPQLVGVSVSYRPSYISIIMYGVVLQELQYYLHVGIIRVMGIYHFVRLELPVSEIVLPEGVSVLLFYKNYIVYYNVYLDYIGVFIEMHVYDWLLHQ